MASFGVAAQTARLLDRLAAARSSVQILVVTDSTGVGAGCWPELVTAGLADRYPGYRVGIRHWSHEDAAYGAVEPRSAPPPGVDDPRPLLTVFNLARGGKSTDYALGHVARGVIEVDPDLIYVSLGLNEAFDTVPPPDADQCRAQYLALTETMARIAPRAGMVLVLQNPETTSTVMAMRNTEYRRVAKAVRCGVVDVHSAFLARARWRTELMRDGRHPNDAGQRLWAAEVRRGFVRKRSDRAPLGRRPSSFDGPGSSVLVNGDFGVWDGPTPVGWSVRNAVADAVAGDPESGSATACRLRSSGTGSPGYLEASLSEQVLAAVRGRRMTVAARVRVRPGRPPAMAGLLEVDQRIGRLNRGQPRPAPQRSRVATLMPGQYVWVCVTCAVRREASAVTVRLYASAGADPGDVTVDRISAVPGILPRDCPATNSPSW